MTPKLQTSQDPKKLARQAAYLYLLLIPLGLLGIIYTPEFILVAGDASATIANIAHNESMFRLSIISALAVQVAQLFAVFALYRLLKPAGRKIGLLMVAFILVAIPIAMLNELNHVAALNLVTNPEHFSAFTLEQSNAMIMFALDLHADGVMIAHIFWGLWLLPMGILVYQSGFIPRFIGLLLIIGSFGYVADSLIWFLLPDVDVLMSQFTFIGELILPLWLLTKGIKTDIWHKKQSNAIT